MPQPGQKGLTFRASFVEGIEKFIDKHLEKGWTSVPEAVRCAWDFYVFVHDREERLQKTTIPKAVEPI